MIKKQRYGKIENELLFILSNNNEYVEYSLRLLASKIKGIDRTTSQYDSVRFAVNRLEKDGIIETKEVPVYGGKITYFVAGVPSKLLMVRLRDFYTRNWECEGGIRFLNEFQLVPTQSNCKV